MTTLSTPVQEHILNRALDWYVLAPACSVAQASRVSPDDGFVGGPKEGRIYFERDIASQAFRENEIRDRRHGVGRITADIVDLARRPALHKQDQGAIEIAHIDQRSPRR